MRDCYLIGAHTTTFGKRPNSSYKDLTREAYEGVLADAGMDSGERLEFAWFANCGMWADRQACIRGQVCFTPLIRDGRFPERVPIVNVEGACASASMALHGAWKDVLSGQCEASLAIGVEKTYMPDDWDKAMEMFQAGIDNLDPEEWRAYYREAGEKSGKPFAPEGNRTLFMDTYAMQAAHHMKTHGTTQRQIAAAAAKNHSNGALNPKAQYRFEMTPEAVLEDRPVSWPLTRSMCAPIGDGAAAAILCSGEFLKTLPGEVRERAVKVSASALSSGRYAEPGAPGLSRDAARKAYAMAGTGPGDISVAEVHDATAFCEIWQSEMMGFCEPGAGGAYVESGATAIGGALPVNTSGGLVSKGHPVGATGLSMIYELASQLRGEAGDRQVEGAARALAENGGGVIGFEEAACAVTILERV